MKICKLFLATTFIAAFLLIFSGSASKAQEAEQTEKLYTAYNIWYENPKALWCINYKKGNIIPVGTEVKNVAFSRVMAGKKLFAAKKAISFVTVHSNQKYWVNINEKYHAGKTIHDYKEMMFTEKNFDQITEKFSSVEIDAINMGVLVIGMSKPAVIASYGYPPEHRTTSLKNSTWRYWTDRLRSKTIFFDKEGRTYRHENQENEL